MLLASFLRFCLIFSSDTSPASYETPTQEPPRREVPAGELVRRQSEGGVPCGGGFCGAGTSCLLAAAGQSALCCPDGQDCSVIQPMSCNVLVAGFAFGGAIIPVCGRGDDGELTCCPAGFSCKPNGVGSAVCAIIPDDVESFEPPPPPPPPDNSTFVPGGQDNSTVTPPPADNSTFTPSQGDNSTFVPPPADNSTTSLPPVDNSTSPDGTGFVNSTNVKRDDGSSTDAGVPPRSTFAQVPTAGGVVAGVTVGAFFSAASLTFYFWARWTKKRQAEGEVTETGCRPRLWALLLTRRKASVQVVSDALPYHVAVIPDDKGRPKGADGMSLVELPATPLSFSFWSRRLSRSVKGRSTIQRFSTV